MIVPEAYVRARAELGSARPDIARVERALLDAGNDARDIGDMIVLFGRFRNFEFMRRIADVWQRTARPISELRTVGEALRNREVGQSFTTHDMQQSIQQIESLEHELSLLEHAFAEALDTGFRSTLRWLSAAYLVLAAFLTIGAIAFSRLLWRRFASIAAASEASQERLNLVISGSNDGAWDWDMVAGDIYYCPRFKQMLAIPDDEPGYDRRSFNANVHAEDKPQMRAMFHNHLRHDVPYSVDFRLRTRAGNYGWFHARGKVVRNSDGKPIRMAGSVTEISDRKILEAKLAFLATHDSLTGVLNRRRFKEVLSDALRARGAGAEKPTLLYLDLDQFKVVNDTCGHAAGDQLLRDVHRPAWSQPRQTRCHRAARR